MRVWGRIVNKFVKGFEYQAKDLRTEKSDRFLTEESSAIRSPMRTPYYLACTHERYN